MLQFKQDDTEAALILTLTEKVTINEVNYLFVFTHVLTKDKVVFIKSGDDDESDYPNRYNQFTINPSTVFDNRQPGEWHYKVYEQTSDTNTDEGLTCDLLESGKLMIERATAFEFTKYQTTTSYQTYNG